MLPNLSTSQLVKSYNGRTVVNRVSIQVTAGEVVGLLGPNGAGKTTTFYMCVGLVTPDSGTIVLNGQNITQQPVYARARLGLGYLPQETSVFRKLSVQDNIMAVLESMDFPTARLRTQRLDQLLNEFGLERVRHSMANSLSGGERRRVEISRALARSPQFILLDEPFTGVDPLAIQDIQNIIMSLSANGIGVLITDHNVRETLVICHRAYILVEGQVLEEGEPRYIAQSERARRYYLGENFSIA